MAIRAPLPRLSVIALAAMLTVWLAALVATAITKPGGAPVKRALLMAVLLIVAGRGSAFAIKEWLVEAYQIPAGSMMPTLLVGDHIFVKKGRGDTARGDVIVFEFPVDRSTDYVKRVVAVGGDTIADHRRDRVDQRRRARAKPDRGGVPRAGKSPAPASSCARRTPAARTRSCSTTATTRRTTREPSSPTVTCS